MHCICSTPSETQALIFVFKIIYTKLLNCLFYTLLSFTRLLKIIQNSLFMIYQMTHWDDFIYSTVLNSTHFWHFVWFISLDMNVQDSSTLVYLLLLIDGSVDRLIPRGTLAVKNWKMPSHGTVLF